MTSVHCVHQWIILESVLQSHWANVKVCVVLIFAVRVVWPFWRGQCRSQRGQADEAQEQTFVSHSSCGLHHRDYVCQRRYVPVCRDSVCTLGELGGHFVLGIVATIATSARQINANADLRILTTIYCLEVRNKIIAMNKTSIFFALYNYENVYKQAKLIVQK